MATGNGFVPVNKFGENGDVDTGTIPEDVWIGGGAYPFIVAAGQLTVRSTSADDDGDPAGSGASDVETIYLDSAYAEYDITVTLDGTALVNVGTVDCFRLNRAFCNVAGGTTNVGTLLFEVGGTVVGQINPEEGQTTQAIYTVPARFPYAELRSYRASIGRKTAAAYTRVELQFRPQNGAWRVQEVDYPQATGSSNVGVQYGVNEGPRFPSKSDIRVRVTDTSASDSLITARFSLAQKTQADITIASEFS